jgi:hypothetical protein
MPHAAQAEECNEPVATGASHSSAAAAPNAPPRHRESPSVRRPRATQISSATHVFRDSLLRSFWRRPAIMQNCPGLAASPPVPDILIVAGREFAPFSLVRCRRACRLRSGGAARTAALCGQEDVPSAVTACQPAPPRFERSQGSRPKLHDQAGLPTRHPSRDQSIDRGHRSRCVLRVLPVPVLDASSHATGTGLPTQTAPFSRPVEPSESSRCSQPNAH